MTSVTTRPDWLIVCPCGWAREAISGWATKSIRTLHPQLARKDATYGTRVEGPGDGGAGRQLSLT
jgi:hypothetical protein